MSINISNFAYTKLTFDTVYKTTKNGMKAVCNKKHFSSSWIRTTAINVYLHVV